MERNPVSGSIKVPFTCPHRLWSQTHHCSPGTGSRPPPAQLGAAAGHGKGSSVGASALCPSLGRGKQAVTSATENEISWPKRRKNREEKSLVSKLKRKTLGRGFCCWFFLLQDGYKSKNYWKAAQQSCQGERGGSHCSAHLRCCAQHSAALMPPVLGIRDGHSLTHGLQARHGTVCRSSETIHL